jgi:DNA-directed RNA polymerase subunit RPC12/RpoP
MQMSDSSDEAEDLLAYGVAAAKDKDKVEARYFLEWVLRTDADFDQQVEAWYWLSTITDDPAEKRSCLENVLAIDPQYGDARRDLAILDGRLKPDQLVDPRFDVKPVSPGAQLQPQEMQAYKCPRCGARMGADVLTGALVCGFCGYRQTGSGSGSAPVAGVADAPTKGVPEQDWDAVAFSQKGHRWEVPTSRAYKCENCGASVLVPPGQVSTVCPFCGTPHVIHAEAESELMEPTGVMPFRLTAPEAFAAITRWLGAQRFAPRDLGATSTQATPRAVYLPFWTFDMAGEVRWSGFEESEEYRNAARTPTSGTMPLLFTDIIVPGSRSVSADILERLQFDLHLLVPYSPDELANWPAEIYSISPVDASIEAREIALHRAHADHSLDGNLDIPPTVEDVVVVSKDLSPISYKLALLPIWTSSYAYEGSTFHVVVNGNSGEVEGNVPRNAWQSMLKHLMG